LNHRLCWLLTLQGKSTLSKVRSVDDWRTTLRAALRAAIRGRQAHAVAVLRETLAAIDNAEAVDTSAAPPVQHGVIAGGVPGLGAGDLPRRTLGPDEVAAIIEREIAERREAADVYAALGRTDEAAALRQQVEALLAL
jgi:uncharacterized protein YqeY